jgi:hypothetical protein
MAKTTDKANAQVNETPNGGEFVGKFEMSVNKITYVERNDKTERMYKKIDGTDKVRTPYAFVSSDNLAEKYNEELDFLNSSANRGSTIIDGFAINGLAKELGAKTPTESSLVESLITRTVNKYARLGKPSKITFEVNKFVVGSPVMANGKQIGSLVHSPSGKETGDKYNQQTNVDLVLPKEAVAELFDKVEDTLLRAIQSAKVPTGTVITSSDDLDL